MEHRMSCPCCSFFLSNNDLFLPAESERRQETGGLFLLEEQNDDSRILKRNPPKEEEEEEELSSLIHTAAAPSSRNDDMIMMSTAQAWQLLRQEKKWPNRENTTSDNHHHHHSLPIVVDTHGHAHLERDVSDDEQQQHSSAQSALYCLEEEEEDTAPAPPFTQATETPTSTSSFISLTCAVQQADWDACLAYAASSEFRMAAIGIHPWYLSNLTDNWLGELERILQNHAGVMVGEIGLCKMARFLRTYAPGKAAALALQRNVFVQQLQLAAKYQRPVSIHGVQQQGVLLDIFKEQQQQLNPQKQIQQLLLPPAMALHSFTGTAHQVKQLLAWESSLNLSSSQQPLLYFGFSHAVNHAMCSSEKSRRQGREAIRAIPRNRLLAESDLHVTRHILGGTVASIAHLAWALDTPDIVSVALQTRDNALRFFQRLH
jgi:Tat protein secretion system quality control protein TatD with DNase activity